MNKFKYIVLDNGELESGIIFPDWIQHKDMAKALQVHGKPVKAGFLCVRDGGIRCFGESDSLKLKASVDDEIHFLHLIG